jgi:hypothetical protein
LEFFDIAPLVHQGQTWACNRQESPRPGHILLEEYLVPLKGQ